MYLTKKTLEILRDLINESTEYRSGPQIINFFAIFDYKDVYGNDYLKKYGQSFPSRWIYTDQRLSQINDTTKLDLCIKSLFNPINYIDNLKRLDDLIADFNKYVQFDKLQIIRKNTDIKITSIQEINLDAQSNIPAINNINYFIQHEFNISFTQLNLMPSLLQIIEMRMIEIEKSFIAEAYLAVVLLAGSTLEGILLNIASHNPRAFNSSSKSPKKDEKVKSFDQWALNNFIEVAHSIGLIEKDTYRFSKELRDFRNYIHPFQQMTEQFNPREQTAKICLQVLKSAITDIYQNESKIK